MSDKTCAGFGVVHDEPMSELTASLINDGLNSRQRAVALTRGKILAAARASFEEVGYERTTMRDLASLIGMSTGAVFANFADKEALYAEVYGHRPITPEVGRELLEAARELRTLVSPTFIQSTMCANAEAVIAKAGA